MATDEVEAWERQPGEPAAAHAAFRIYRDLPPVQRNLAAVAQQVGAAERTLRSWAVRWEWRERAAGWDDRCHLIEDQERLEAIRTMHSTHQQAGRAAVTKALDALELVQPSDLSASAIARLLELGAKLERSTLTVSVEELQGVEVEDDTEDPWEKIARELDPVGE